MTPSTRLRPVSGLQLVLAVVSFVLAVATASADPLTLASRPLYAGGNVPPLVMIDLSKDHSLHQKAYNDYTDLNGDGKLDTATETTYNNGHDYAGYFDANKCYTYDTTNSRFNPSSVADSNRYCDGKWGGNFLNWATMSRIDEVRKILYGGKRVVDSSTMTVLERAYLPMDAHAWAKYYGGSDLSHFVPLTPLSKPANVNVDLGSGNTRSLAGGTVTIPLSSVSNFAYGDQVKLHALDSSNTDTGNGMVGWVSGVNGSGSSKSINVQVDGNDVYPAGTTGSSRRWMVENLTLGGVTLCNVTPKDANNLYSQTNTMPPEIRVVSGNYATWGASERWQCNWHDENNNTQGNNSSNGNRAQASGMTASAENPPRNNTTQTWLATGGRSLGAFIARVQVCVAGLLESDGSCTQYSGSSGTGVYKPTGLLQQYGASGQMKFGLMTGSYDKNISGGVLRRNIGSFSDEVNSADGTFKSSVNGIVRNIDRLRPYGYSYSDGTYFNGSSGDSCNYQQTGIVPAGTAGGGSNQNQPAYEGNCSTWGNPMSEIYVESLRYFAGKTARSDFAQKSNGKDSALSLTTEAWVDPLSGTNRAPYCSPLNTLVFNSSVSSYDDDQTDGSPGFKDLNTSDSIKIWTNKVGTGEGIPGKSWFAGGVGSTVDNMCSAKSVSAFADVLGICSEGPSQRGTFQIAGAALFAHMNRIRDGAALGVPANDTTSLKVSTYAVQLATNTPRISVNVGGKSVTIMPAYQLHPTNVQPSTGTLVDFKVISQTLDSSGNPTAGKFYVNWEDSIAGGDYDQDVWGILSYSVTGSQIKVTTQVIARSSANGQGFGYSISGTDKDGTHFHSGSYSFIYSDPTPVSVTSAGSNSHLNSTGGCQGCDLGDPATTVTFNVTGNAGNQFLDPLYYAAKWGGFKDLNGSGTPDQTSEWDVYKSDGSAGSDGLPDNYFYANDPAALASALERAFISILQTSSASSVATNSSSLTTGSRIYQARFNATEWSGQLQAYAVSNSGVVTYPALWDAGALLRGADPNGRAILTYDNTVGSTTAGIPFRWGSLPATYKTLVSQSQLNWVRGDQSNEGRATGKFRVRPNTLLGDIVNSSPQYVGPPSAGYADASYLAFATANKSRKPMLYVGANDGMLHAFSASSDTSSASDAGKELFAYVPSPLYGKLATLTDPAYSHAYYVDGTPAIADAQVNGNWTTILVGGLNAGGGGIYALDVTDPTAVTEGAAASKVLWEFTSANDADLGFTFGKPSIIKLASGRWAAIFGNGYNATTGSAKVFVVFLDRPAGSKSWVNGTDYVKLSIPASYDGNNNGMSEPFPADVDGDGTTDYIYAGDLHGNLWKFDVRNASPSAWQRQPANAPLFVATDANAGGQAQPITSSVDVIRAPAAQPGYMVLFGTGRYIDVTDPTSRQVQTFYGLWDQNVATQTTIPRTSLVQQTIDKEVTNTDGSIYRLTSANTVQLSPTGTRGWYMNLVSPVSGAQGERVVYNPQVRGSRIVFVTLIPLDNSCANGGTSWLMELDALSGQRLTVSPFDVNGDGTFSGGDYLNGGSGNIPVSGVQSSVGIAPQPTVTKCGQGRECKFLTGTSGNQETVTESAGAPTGRLSWREILH